MRTTIPFKGMPLMSEGLPTRLHPLKLSPTVLTHVALADAHPNFSSNCLEPGGGMRIRKE